MSCEGTESFEAPEATMQPFTPGQCLFCPRSAETFADSLVHMQKMHGFVVPEREHVVFDLEPIFEHLHLVIFGYRECLQCGTQRATVQGVQQHMTGKGHCRFDISDPESEFGVFYDYSYPEDDYEAGENVEGNWEDETRSAGRKQTHIGDDCIRLPSGKIVSKRSATQGLSANQIRRRTRAAAAQIKDTPSSQPDEAITGEVGASTGDNATRALAKREKRQEKAAAEHRLVNLRASDRNSLMHLPAAEQRSLLAAQFRHTERAQKQERRRQGKIDRKGNKNLYAYWHTETPVYQCG